MFLFETSGKGEILRTNISARSASKPNILWYVKQTSVPKLSRITTQSMKGVSSMANVSSNVGSLKVRQDGKCPLLTKGKECAKKSYHPNPFHFRARRTMSIFSCWNKSREIRARSTAWARKTDKIPLPPKEPTLLNPWSPTNRCAPRTTSDQSQPSTWHMLSNQILQHKSIPENRGSTPLAKNEQSAHHFLKRISGYGKEKISVNTLFKRRRSFAMYSQVTLRQDDTE